MKKNYILGLDVGISSVGWGLLELDENDNPFRIIDVGSRIFTPGEVEKTGDSRAKERREKRGARRIARRREFRVDRVRNLLYENSFLRGNVTSDIVSVKNEELSFIFDNMINNYYKDKDTNPYKLKVEALDRKLTNEELSIILVHYAKKRGYKSNREEALDSESGKVLSSIKENEKIMTDNNYRTISEMYIKDEKFKDKIKNSPGNYKLSVSNEMYLDEINKVLDSQVKYGLIDNKFKEEYIEIWSSRRHYSSGPGGNSPYGGDLIAKMTGKCAFDKKPRAPKRAPSSEIFVSLSKLLNLRYKTDGDYTSLTKEEINILLDKAKEKNNITYNDVAKLLDRKNIKFKNLQLSKKDYVKVIEELKKKLNVSKDKKLDINSLDEEAKTIYNSIYQKKLFDNTLIELKGYHTLRSKIIKALGETAWNEVKNNIDFLDYLSLLCTNYKLNEEIKKHLQELPNTPEEYLDDNFIEALPNFKDHLMLSTDIIRSLIPIMLDGMRYDEAMEKLGYSHSDLYSDKEKQDLLVPINITGSITNQRVIRSLTQTRKVINAIIKKYGSPKIINIETARELAKTMQERREIEKSQLEKKEKNEKMKNHLVELGLFNDKDRITGNDLLKYKLWEEQDCKCGYSRKPIKIEELFQNNIVQIDHILPYSRTYNDNYLNKTLVLTRENQDKGNKTPYEWFGKTDRWTEYEAFINSLNIPQGKKDNYLLKILDFDIEREMREQNLNDTKYISRELSSLIKAYLNVEKVNVYPGAITSKLRGRWGFNRLTHSYISKTYYMPEDMKEDINKDRDNHLHHAMDALVIASITPSLQQKITLYEKFSRYVDGLTKNQLKEFDYLKEDDDNVIFYDDKGVVIDTVDFKEYIKEQVSKEHVYFSKHDIAKLSFPLPYENFDKEAKLRVYEQDLEKLRWDLKELSTYTSKDIEKVHTLTPSIAKTKISGKMHEETYYGVKKVGENTYKTIRTPLEKLKKKDLENIPDRLNGSKDIYNAIIEWFGTHETGEEALKSHDGKYPVNPNDKERKEIKKVKKYLEYKNTGHMINNSNVEKGGIYRIDIFKSKNDSDDKLYFAAYDIFDIKKIEGINKKQNNTDFNIKLEYGQSDKNKVISYKEVLENYDLYLPLYKNDLIKVTLNDGRESTAYVVGESSGMLEVKSKLGDGYDIIGDNNIFGKKRERFSITVSTIKSIEKLSISILGEISGL